MDIDKTNIRPEEYYAHLRKLQRREWWMWGVSVIIMLLLTFAVASLSLPTIFEQKSSPFGSGVLQAVSGLVCLIILFGCYLTYEKILINRLRLELAERQIHSTLWRNLALVDPLTGLYNRRFAERRLKAEIARSERKGYPLTLVLFDLNSFKQINDRFGHPAGDLVLKEFGVRLGNAVREGDLAARLGGDEFMLLLTECDSSQLPSVLARLESIVVDIEGEKMPVGFSVGWKEYELGQTPKDFHDAADKALYQDKQARKKPQLAPTK
ncbi:MAG: GGDEF domain-containing protein [Candidatus Acidiferrales bacterium]